MKKEYLFHENNSPRRILILFDKQSSSLGAFATMPHYENFSRTTSWGGGGGGGGAQ